MPSLDQRHLDCLHAIARDEEGPLAPCDDDVIELLLDRDLVVKLVLPALPTGCTRVVHRLTQDGWRIVNWQDD
ncbi:MAG: hypothetical protein M5U09_04165 [Gammaproteobacteria bacterium]|nr:hypothetical protein [Gammaproteobacteria bacterium]